MAYTSFTTKFDEIPYLGCLPTKIGEVVTYNVSKYVPADAKEILIYLFVTVQDSPGSQTKRSVYEIFTRDASEMKYSQLMNTVFTQNDFVMNSANLWLPIFNERKLSITLPQEWSVDTGIVVKHSFKTFTEAMKAYVRGDEKIFADVFLLGYRK